MACTVTGDIKNNVRKMQLALRKISFEKDLDLKSIIAGEPQEHLRIYHYIFSYYSHGIAKLIAELGIDLLTKTDLRFMEAVYKILREIFSYHPPINRDQFFSSSFAERKVIMTTEIVDMVYRKHRSMPKPKGSSGAASSSRPRPKMASKDLEMRDFDRTAAARHNATAPLLEGVNFGVRRHLPGNTTITTNRPASAGSGQTGTGTGTTSGSCRTGAGPSRADSPVVVTGESPSVTSSPVFCDSGKSVAGAPDDSQLNDREVSYAFAEPIDIVAASPQTGVHVPGRHRTSSPIEKSTCVQPENVVSREEMRTMLDDMRAELLESTKQEFKRELETMSARLLILENKFSILQSAYDKLASDSRLTEVTSSSRDSRPEPLVKQGVLLASPGGVLAPVVVVGTDNLTHLNHLPTPDDSGHSDDNKENRSGVGDSPMKLSSEEALQNVVTSLVNDVMAEADCDMSDVDLQYVRSPTVTQAERMFDMIKEINQQIKN